MQRKRQRERDQEPAVTFELDEAPRAQRRGQMGAVGALSVAGAGLVSSAAADLDDSLDVFDQLDDAAGQAEDVPVTSFQELTATAIDPEFPRIDFASTAELEADIGVDPLDASESTFGAVAEVGGGFALEDVAADEAFGVPDIDMDIDPFPMHCSTSTIWNLIWIRIWTIQMISIRTRSTAAIPVSDPYAQD